MDRRAEAALRRIAELHGGAEPWWMREGLDEFWTALSAVLSPRTTDRLTRRALLALMERFPGGAAELASAPLEELERAVSVSGMARAKARAVRAFARWVESGGDLGALRRLPTGEAREILKGIRGVGDKVADVILMALGHPVLPVDVHVARISRRLGAVPDGARYEEIRGALESVFRPGERMRAHFALIDFGRRVCRARPRCGACPVADLCPSAAKF